MIDYLQLLFAILIFLSSIYLTKKDILYGFLFFLFLTPLLHKEDFSLIIWDLLPVRIAFLGLVIGIIYKHASLFLNYRKYFFLYKIIKKYLYKDIFFWCLFILLIQRGISLGFVNNFEFSIKLYVFYASVAIIYVIVKYLFVKNNYRFITLVFNTLLYLGLGTGIFAVIQYALRLCCRKSIGAVWVIPGYTPRLGSTFWDVNHFGGFLAIVIPIAFVFVFIAKSKLKRSLYLLLTISLCIILALTQSRSAWMGLGVGFISMMFLFYLQNYRKVIIAVVGSIILISSAFVIYGQIRGYTVLERAANFMHHRLDSTDTHMFLLEGASEIFVNNLVLGAGYGNFDTAFRGTQISEDYFSREPTLKEVKVPPHSVWGEVLSENGGLGIILYTVFMIANLLFIITSIFNDKSNDNKLLGIGIFTSIISILVTGLFYSYNLEFFWVLMFTGIAYSYVSLKENFNLFYLMNWWYKKPISAYLIILPLAVFYMFINLGKASLVDWDEAIYAKVAKNILIRNDWITLAWDNLKENWHEKPPFYMWLTAFSFSVTGFNAFGARFFSAVFGVLNIIYVYKFGKVLYDKYVGIVAALILISTVHFLYYSRSAMIDVTLSFFLLSSLYYLYCYYFVSKDKRSSRQKILLVAAGVLMGFGVLTKAILGFLVLPIFILFVLITYFYVRISLELRIKDLMYFILPAAVVFLPWHLISYYLHGYEFIKVYLIDHMIERGLDGLGHEKPLLWFLEVIKVSFRIWCIPLILGLILLPIYDRHKKQYVLLVSAITVIFVFFSLSKDKLQWYIVPIYPYIALLSARFIDRSITSFNQALRSPYQFTYKNIRFISIFILYLVSAFYVVIMRDRIFFPDVNKDKVALIKINNGTYPVNKYPDRKLYYSKISKPVALFYSDSDVKEVNKEQIVEIIKESKPNEDFSFLTPASVFYAVKSTAYSEDSPIIVSIKGSAGDWVLYTSNSRVEILNNELNAVNVQLRILYPSYLLNTLLPEQKVTFYSLTKRRNEIVKKLTDYGFTPE